MTALRDILLRQIALNGPMTVADYMTACLLHPVHGYYTTHDPLGAQGDFITAPEISQMFGELVGLALAQAWLDRGSPAPFCLAELGPGRGTLMIDLLRATRRVPGFHAAVRVVLVEASDRLRAAQSRAVPTAEWVGGVDDLPDLPLFLVANEFFDALPIRQFLRDGDGWRERLVDAADGDLRFALSEIGPVPRLEARRQATQPGDTVETCAAAQSIAQVLGERIASHGGVALLFDYGQDSPVGDTFQAVKDHKNTNPLIDPGAADLTAHVDFEALATAASCPASATVPQGVWLERLGITARATALAQNLTGAALENHVAAHRRLTHPDEMGELFKVMALHDTAGPPPGLEPRL
ncbi:hypothetical protein PARPLA_02209 [Rhodobacteraceae bacterium THAF1]|uniref:class I SAM-dependent methyltransferase n=1 Tax=Palleronia sp. THAF1 TaxID=2587842 RepID=UPI000F3AEC34|nr:SAM-dependent methyltransferase [Palleronia sp. THAF1]QFU07921.1 hypothetical protein FIU81_04450 [Palleronia sp. THAF1]VDC25755.1 hypothetical protein PARPLA_02209 [Rhodobacteraceae bacterium THAF1]